MKRKELRVEKFLNEMNTVVPWKSLTEIIKPHYKKFGGRPPHDLELMLRIHFLQLWNNLSDPVMEEALYDRISSQIFSAQLQLRRIRRKPLNYHVFWHIHSPIFVTRCAIHNHQNKVIWKLFSHMTQEICHAISIHRGQNKVA